MNNVPDSQNRQPFRPCHRGQPHGTGPFATEGTGHLLDSRNKGWKEISLDAVAGYFSGNADGMGFEVPPDDDFESLEAVEAWVKERYEPMTEEEYRELFRKLKELGIPVKIE